MNGADFIAELFEIPATFTGHAVGDTLELFLLGSVAALLQLLNPATEHDVNRIGTGEVLWVVGWKQLQSLGERIQLGGKRNERSGLGPSPYFSPCLRHANPITG